MIRVEPGAPWKALISRYIVTIPLSGDTRAAEQSISAGPSPRTPVSSAMMAKVGDAARASPSAAQSAAASRPVAPPSHPPEQAGSWLRARVLVPERRLSGV